MNKLSSIFGQILQIFDKHVFLQAIRNTNTERAAKTPPRMSPKTELPA